VRTSLWMIGLLGLAALAAGTREVRAAQDEKDPAAELAKQFESVPRQRFYRHGSSVFDAVTRFSQIEEDRISPADRFLRAYYQGQWDEVRATLAKLPQNLADAIYDKMLADLTGRDVPILSLDDYLGLADACPGELNTGRVQRLGQLLRVAVPKEQELWLKRALEKGTRRLGRSAAHRLATGRILLHADFGELARQYLPTAVEAAQLDDAEARDEIVKFLASQEELAELQQTQFGALWKQHIAVLSDEKADSGAKSRADQQLVELLGRAPMASIEPWVRALMADDPSTGLGLASTLGRFAQTKISDSDVAVRTNNLKVQKVMLLAAADHADLGQPPWQQVAAAMADWWMREAENAFQQRSAAAPGKPPRAHVGPEDLLDAAPDGPWANALPASLRERVDVSLSKAVLVSDRYEGAVALIVDLAKRNPGAGTSLAEEYLKTWAQRHSPEIPEAIRKKHQLPDDTRIMVTPIMMEKNIDSLAAMMDVFRKQGVAPRNAALLVEAFAVCYGTAEVYQRGHLEKVFGPVAKMDEEVFGQMIRTMTEGLASRWRKIELQNQSGTRRTAEETLAMVRRGYQAAVEMIAERSKKHPDAWRVLMLAGSLYSDWADFEYYQELGAETKVKRAEAFREKNNRAEQYFTLAAEAYAREVPKLARSAYTIDVYLAWFHSLLGISTSGDLNLSKPLDRAALNKIREMIRGLPGEAAKAHVDKLARLVNARLEDAERPLHEDLKYKYLAGSLVITRDSPFSFQASSKVSYYDELLDEIRLETRVDGPSTVHRDQPFGILLCVRHTEAIGRMADFGKYLVNDTPTFTPHWVKPAQPLATVYRSHEIRGRRDELELNLREALSLYFDIQSITFSPRDVQPRSLERPGWKETVLAYLLVKAKDASVDKIPRVQMNLDFLDLTGPISIAAESPETMLKVTDRKVPPRPFERVDLTQVLDARNLADSDEALLEISATANGLVPELDELVDLEAFGKQLPVARIDPREGLLVKEIQSWGETVHAVSQRQWTVVLDASSLREPPRQIDLRLPAPKTPGAAAKYQAYVDADLVDLAEPVASLGSASGAHAAAAPAPSAIPAWAPYAGLGGGLAVLLAVGLVIARVVQGRGERPLRARDVFHMPAQLDGFVAVQLFRALESSELIRMTDAQRRQLRDDVDRIQAACFGDNGDGGGLTEDELRDLARKWLRLAR